MKPKKISQKLSLNKKTIAHLNGIEMKDVYGGTESGSIKWCCPESIEFSEGNVACPCANNGPTE